MWMDLETVIPSEVSQKEKNKCHIFTLGIQKNGVGDLICKKRNRDRDVKNKHMDTKEEGEWDGLGDWDQHVYTTIYKTYS